VVDLRNVADDLVRVNAGAAGLAYDLSTPELTVESACAVVEVYGTDGARRLAVAILAILDPASPTALAAPIPTTIH